MPIWHEPMLNKCYSAQLMHRFVILFPFSMVIIGTESDQYWVVFYNASRVTLNNFDPNIIHLLSTKQKVNVDIWIRPNQQWLLDYAYICSKKAAKLIAGKTEWDKWLFDPDIMLSQWNGYGKLPKIVSLLLNPQYNRRLEAKNGRESNNNSLFWFKRCFCSIDEEIQRPGKAVKFTSILMDTGGIHGQYDWFNLTALVGKFVHRSNLLLLTILYYLWHSALA